MKKNRLISLIIRIFKSICTIKKKLLWTYSFLIVSQELLILLTLFIPKMIIEALLQGKTKLAFYAVGLLIIGSIFLTLSNKLLRQYINNFLDEIRLYYSIQLNKTFMEMDFERVETAEIREKKNLAFEGLENYIQIINNLFQTIQNIINIFVIAVSIFVYDIILIGLVVIGASIYFLFQYKLLPDDLNMHEEFNKLFTKWGYIAQTTRNIDNAKEIRFYDLSEWLSKKASYFAQDNRKLLLKSTKLDLIKEIIRNLISNIEFFLIYIYVINQAIVGHITIGQFTQYISALITFSNSLFQIAANGVALKKNCILIENFYQILDEHDRIEDNEQRSAHNPIIDKNDGFEIHIQDIWFRYPSQEQYVLRGVNLVINRNETLSLVGKNGSGKTTLVKLILRLYKPERGKIYINGIDINQISLTEYYKLLSVVFQDFQIFAFSIRDNILMSAIPDPDNNSENEQRDATMARVKSAIRSAGLAPDIQNLEKKENTFLSKELSDDGIEFSGGMMQKLAMARAYYKDSKLIILDEPTAMLDPLQEYEIYKHFNELIKMQSAIFISHRMSSCRFCDKIAVLNNGVIEEYGTHDELIQQKGLYSFLYGSQAEKYSFY